ncbi:MAG TPA: ScaI family restriction endonuclease [Gammaproteobacteria bacterium]|nr:ScaI family restriction endonuclease [Gammaproteobacteria bacterium]
MTSSPYLKKDKSEWKAITEKIIKKHPLDQDKLVEMVLSAWSDIFETSIGRHNLKIGKHIFPKPQVIGALLHELIPAELAASSPKKWRGEITADDKDIVYIPDDFYSIELKTSSNVNHYIFGNRSYAQKPTVGKKGKDGFYIAVNFEKFSKTNSKPGIAVIRFGWLDHTDWVGQESATGQQARLAPETYDLKFKTLYRKG